MEDHHFKVAFWKMLNFVNKRVWKIWWKFHIPEQCLFQGVIWPFITLSMHGDFLLSSFNYHLPMSKWNQSNTCQFTKVLYALKCGTQQITKFVSKCIHGKPVRNKTKCVEIHRQPKISPRWPFLTEDGQFCGKSRIRLIPTRFIGCFVDEIQLMRI